MIKNHQKVNLPQATGAIAFDVAAGFCLRAAHDSDAEPIIEFISSIWSEYHHKILDASRDMPDACSYAEADGRFWVLEWDISIVGTIALKPGTDSNSLELQKLYVGREYRRMGLGTFLCGLVEHEAVRRGCTAIELWSDIKLADAHRLYGRLGYARGTVLRKYDDTSATVRCYYYKEITRP